MVLLPIITAPDPLLRTISLPVKSVDNEITKLMDDMLSTMYHDKGVGLAAIQVGVPKRVIVLDLQNDDQYPRSPDFYPLFIANPEIIDRSTEMVVAIEGCLSLPEQKVEVARSSKIRLRFLDYRNNNQELEVEGWLARAILHEIDHLDGKLLVDYLSSVKKDYALRKLKKLKRHYS